MNYKVNFVSLQYYLKLSTSKLMKDNKLPEPEISIDRFLF